MPTQMHALVDKFLTNVSNKITPQGYVSEEILPLINVQQYSGKIGKYGNDHLRIVNTLTGGKNEYPRVQTDVRSSDSYYIETHGLSDVVTDEDYRNVELPFDAERDSAVNLTTRLWLGKEKSLADTLGDMAIITQNVTLAGTNQYNDFTNSDPLGDFIDARNAIYASVGTAPDTVIMSWGVANTLRYHPALVRSLGYADNRVGQLTNDDLARALLPGIPNGRVLVGGAIYNSAKQGQADVLAPVWGKNIIFAVAPRNATIMQVSLG